MIFRCGCSLRDRSIRIQIGSRTERQARMYVSRIKKSLERDAPLRADTDNLERGIAFDADACLLDDFGAFKPEGRQDLWRGEALVVRQLDGVSLDDKEASGVGVGQDSGFLGWPVRPGDLGRPGGPEKRLRRWRRSRTCGRGGTVRRRPA